ncbi:MAG: tetratricopeptide repeat protein [Verrucomicrobia bacterium]|nr:tetratricopeptide repeat protein [Verrucomicrobiota bacterium]MBS0646273.1 tetratricopeptide repeat protein [Verrucomicrobiota bacterium]
MTKTLDIVAKAFQPANLAKKANELVEKIQKEKKTFKEASGISDRMENEFYVLAKHYYDQGRYGEAVALFSALSRINPTQYAYLYGLGSCYHQLKDYLNASLGFYGAFSINPEEPMTTYYLADCFVHLGSKDDAVRFLDLTISIAEAVNAQQYASLTERCRLIKDKLKKETKS